MPVQTNIQQTLNEEDQSRSSFLTKLVLALPQDKFKFVEIDRCGGWKKELRASVEVVGTKLSFRLMPENTASATGRPNWQTKDRVKFDRIVVEIGGYYKYDPRTTIRRYKAAADSDVATLVEKIVAHVDECKANVERYNESERLRNQAAQNATTIIERFRRLFGLEKCSGGYISSYELAKITGLKRFHLDVKGGCANGKQVSISVTTSLTPKQVKKLTEALKKFEEEQDDEQES